MTQVSSFMTGLTHDAGGFDAGVERDAGLPDAGVDQDAGVPDAGIPDSGVPDSGVEIDAGLGPDFVIEGFDEYLVTTLDDSGPGSLREGLNHPPGPRIIRFARGGSITLSTPLFVPSNITIDVRGFDIALTGKGLILFGSDDVIIINLALVDIGPDSEDGLRIGDPTGPSERVVLDHVTFRATGRRHALNRYGIADVWNCYFDDWRMYDWFFLAPYRESFGAQSQDGARVRVENSLFRRTAHTYDTGSQANDATRCESNGKLDGVGLVTASGSTAPLAFNVGCSGSTGWVRRYVITLDAADPVLQQRLLLNAGNTLH